MSTTSTFTDPDADAAAITAMSRDELIETGPELLRQSRKYEARTVLAAAALAERVYREHLAGRSETCVWGSVIEHADKLARAEVSLQFKISRSKAGNWIALADLLEKFPLIRAAYLNGELSTNRASWRRPPNVAGISTPTPTATATASIPVTSPRCRSMRSSWTTDPTGHGARTVPPPGALTYAPSAALRAEVLTNDAWCRYPYCGRPSHLCDLDHWRPFNHTDPEAGGWTVLGDLIPLCRADHQRKHLAEWVPTLFLDRRLSGGVGGVSR